jgi:exportin-2 (importin alpha re-exporter)
MEPTAENMQHLGNFLSQTLSPDTAVRKQAEAQLSQAKLQGGYATLLLRLIIQPQFPAEIRMQAAIQFKNLVNQHWVSSETHDYSLSDVDKMAVKSEIVAAMLTAPEKLQPFLSEALGTMSNADFPLDRKWPELIPQLMQSMDSPDPSVVQATLRTTHAISRKYRTASHTDELWAEINMVLKHTHDRLLHTQTTCLAAMEANAGNKQALEVIFQTLELIARIYYDLNYQDIPGVGAIPACMLFSVL